ncbi:YicC/YloC family endoribonuclease [Brevundimonas lutea]|uniref:YicC/YloC family endoribonuclease n=1 Tax=Brevundimonas lutea TaxID=2293980 RepID=UPI000F039C1E|nr:YicC/YloC family endoribonuclease [Brevundimonas lutea]
MTALSGMTGFGRAEGAAGDWSWTVEARSVNGRSLEVRFRGPPGFDALEKAARDAAQARFARGQLTVGVQARRTAGQGALAINRAALDQYLALARELEASGATPASAHGLLSLRGVVEVAEEADDAEALAAVQSAIAADIAAALDALKAAREGEGAALRPVILGFIDRIETLVGQAETEAASQTDTIRERFTRRMRELAPEADGLEDRIVTEAASLAVRADVREEIDRLRAHIAAARALISAPPAGRKLDFLMQEFMREANTLCSKSATTALTAVGLELKATIEQLREQIQNVE